ncbi:PREDICTED: wiskott-Aldrich syndrome protein homolog 1-like [Chinchilla lanigera]|uniref:wiskott-Aldrich syndrome protein homolog 1-like n=1 Tax=Chinchilla lanigera TaxID=34839 RepID=UPI00038ED545|nr:PREDICTED: wiskott-Aldrich syndrome protein homolog 1-like [Chinchilla lanigera]
MAGRSPEPAPRGGFPAPLSPPPASRESSRARPGVRAAHARSPTPQTAPSSNPLGSASRPPRPPRPHLGPALPPHPSPAHLAASLSDLRMHQSQSGYGNFGLNGRAEEVSTGEGRSQNSSPDLGNKNHWESSGHHLDENHKVVAGSF